MMYITDMVTQFSMLALILLLFEKTESSVELARGKPADSNAIIDQRWSASKAVDGNTNTNLQCNSCLHTNWRRPSYLKVDLQEIFTINRVIIHFPVSSASSCEDTSKDNDTKEKFQQRLMRSTIRTHKVHNNIWGDICHKDEHPPGDYKDFNLLQNISCFTDARYVSIVQYYVSEEPQIYTPIMAVCELQIFGCQVGRYGVNCEKTCSNDCLTGKCDPDLGCLECDNGLKGPDCLTECPAFTYGDWCGEVCGKCIDNAVCDEGNGHCPNSLCKRGYRGSLCKEECTPGEYGFNCNETCGYCLNGEACDIQNGNCKKGCSLGYHGSLCKTECDFGFYGYNCNETCGKCLHNQSCDSEIGHCPSCEEGFIYPLCKEQCPNGTYGYHCNETCGYCMGGEHCHWKNGMCPNGCDLGYSGQTCKTECENGTYGFNCKDICGNCIGNETCHGQFGNCSACKPGYNDSLCKQPCEGQFGQNCERNCGQCRNGQLCHHITGVCEDGRCARGYHGELCLEQCTDNKFGFNCAENCSFCRENEQCDIFYGNCSACQSGYTGNLCNMRELEQVSESSSTAIIGGSVGAIVILMVAILVIVLFNVIRKRRKRDPEKRYMYAESLEGNSFKETGFSTTKKDGQSYLLIVVPTPATYTNVSRFKVENDDEEEKDLENTENQQYANVVLKQLDESSYDISVDDLLIVIEKKSDNENKGFIEEYQHLPKGQLKPCTHAEKAENRVKNRFKSTFPYDDTRVRLETGNEEESDYINANYISNLDGRKAYIACQGPKDHTIIDMWRMIWQEKISQTVMVTNIKEQNKMKCSKYWPDVNSCESHGVFNISTVDERIYSNFTIRNLSVYHSQRKETRNLTHFQYTTWPDHGVPEADNLVAFHHRIKRSQSLTNTNNTKAPPLLVHCSAGIGRTGTFIALDALSESCKHAKTINVFKYIKKIREEDRMNMVQTVEQYAAVHRLLHESLRMRFYPIERETLSEEVNKICSTSVPTNQNKLRAQMMELSTLKPIYTDKDFSGGMQNQNLNVDPKILPVDKFRVFLSSYVKGRSDYINAVTIPTQTDEKGIIVTNFPSSKNTVDLLRLLVDHGAILVSLQMANSSAKEWVQSITSSPDLDPYAVEMCTNSESTESNSFNRCTLNITHKKDSTSDTFPVFETTFWPTKYTDNVDLNVITDLVLAVKEVKNTTEKEGKTVVVSKDGVSGCDIFCAVYNAMEQLDLDNEIDMFNILRKLQIRRPQFVPTVDEYALCLKSAANIPPSSENIYVNL